MFRPLEIYIGLRYLRAKRRTHLISFISLASVGGIALAVATLIVILSIMNGFENDIRERLLSMTSHATITGADGRLENWHQVVDVAKQHPEIVESTPYVEMQAMLTSGPELNPALVRGVIPASETRVSAIAGNMLYGSIDDLSAGSGNMVLGKLLALNLGVGPGDKVTVMVPTGNSSGTGITPKLRRFMVSGIFEAGIQEHDGVLAMIHLSDASELGSLGDSISGVRFAMDDIFAAPTIVKRLVEDLGPDFKSSDWSKENASYFRAIKIEKSMMAVILLLIVAVALFNVVASLVMVVADKRNDIAILRTIGLKPAGVVGVFMTQGVVLGWAGTLAGVLIGVPFAANVGEIAAFVESLFNFRIFDPSVYYITDIPSDIHTVDIVWISVTAFVLAVLATIYPARRAASTDPAVALRYE